MPVDSARRIHRRKGHQQRRPDGCRRHFRVSELAVRTTLVKPRKGAAGPAPLAGVRPSSGVPRYGAAITADSTVLEQLHIVHPLPGRRLLVRIGRLRVRVHLVLC